MLENCAMSGAFFETFVVSEVIKNFFAYNRDPAEKLNIMPGLVIDTCDKVRAINEKAYTFPVYLL